MSDLAYRIITICPLGISHELKQFLTLPADDDGIFRMRDVLAINLLKPFKDSSLPFCCTFLGWASSSYPAKACEDSLSLLNGIRITTGNSLISTEGVSHKLDNGNIYLIGAYPLLDMPESVRHIEYNNISFLINKEPTQKLFDWSYRTLLRGALNSDKYGIVVAVQANCESLADHKIHEAVALLGIRK